MCIFQWNTRGHSVYCDMMQHAMRAAQRNNAYRNLFMHHWQKVEPVLSPSNSSYVMCVAISEAITYNLAECSKQCGLRIAFTHTASISCLHVQLTFDSTSVLSIQQFCVPCVSISYSSEAIAYNLAGCSKQCELWLAFTHTTSFSCITHPKLYCWWVHPTVLMCSV